MDKSISDRIYVGSLNYDPAVCAEEQLAHKIEIVEITLREEVAYDVDLTPTQKAELAKLLDDINIPIIQLHAQGAGEVISTSRDLGVRAQFEIICRPYHSYGYGDWSEEVRSAIRAGADIIKASITTPRKWAMGEPGMSTEGVRQKALDSVRLARDLGARRVTLGFTDAPRTDISFLADTSAEAAELGADTILINDTVGVAKPSLIKFLVHTIRARANVGIRVHCHNDFGLATPNTLAAIEAGADSVETVVNGADPARSGIAPLAEVVMALLCLYRKDLGIVTEKLTNVSEVFAKYSGIPIAEQKPVVADRNWMYKRDHIMRTITKDENIQFPYSPSLVGQAFKIGLGRGSGQVGIRAKLKELGLDLPETQVSALVAKVTSEAIQRRRRLSDDEFRNLVADATHV